MADIDAERKRLELIAKVPGMEHVANDVEAAKRIEMLRVETAGDIHQMGRLLELLAAERENGDTTTNGDLEQQETPTIH